MSFQHIEDACRTACESIGVIYKPVPSDGVFHVADLADDHKGKNDARIKVFTDQQGGIVWNHKSGAQQTFFVNRKSGEPAPIVDREHIKREQQRRQLEQQAKHDKAARKARAIWQAAKPAPADHPYLTRKQIKPHGARVGTWARSIQDENGKFRKIVIENCLILPMYNEAGEIRSLQAIFPEHNPDLDRGKDFLPGGGLAGLFWWVGAATNPTFIAEGYSTSISLNEDTNCRVFIAFSAGNLKAVGRIIRDRLPDTKFIFCADNDQNTAGNPGVTKANEAAAEIGADVYTPPIAGDYNDWISYKRSIENERV